LRTVSWVRPKAAERETTARPTPEDLLPVLAGEADPRLDKLKQWIVNVDYQIKDARSRKQDPQQYERLLADFFEVVTELTSDTKIKFKEVNAQTKEITVITDDGELPIEALSQGMTSLIGWVGILLQRMYEVYGTDEDPKQRHALVLMDEYHELLATDRNPTEEKRFQQLREILKARIPMVGETPAEQKAMGLIQALLQTEGDGKYDSVNADILKRAEQLLNEVGKKRK